MQSLTTHPKIEKGSYTENDDYVWNGGRNADVAGR